MGSSEHDHKSTDESSVEKGAGFGAPPVHDIAIEKLANAKALDVSLALPGLTGEHDPDELDPADSRRVRRKLDKRIIPLLMLIYTVQFMDKNGMGSAAILGFLSDNKLSTEQFNNLASIFNVGLLISQWGHSWAFQRFPVAKYMSCMIFLWALFVSMHIVARGYHALIPIRLLLGIAEGSVTPGLMLITSMFYTRVEIAERIGWSFQCNGLAGIITSFISFGVWHAPASTPANPRPMAQWQWFFLVIALITLVAFAFWLLLFPDSPVTAKFLTEEEKAIVVKRMRENQSGVETKVWKWNQFFEVFKDPKTYFMFFYAALANLVSGVGVQYGLIIRGFGFTVMETTLLSMPSGFAMIFSITFSLFILRKFPNARTWIAVASYLPSAISIFCLIFLAESNRTGRLVSFYCMQLGMAPALIMSLSWVTATTSGHTKKVVMNGTWLIGYSIGQICGPQFWRTKYAPRNREPWTIIQSSLCVQVLIILSFRYYLVKLNTKRDQEYSELLAKHPLPTDPLEPPHPDIEPYLEYSIVEVPDEAAPGGVRKEKIEKRFLDLTDLQNKSFRYVL